jgi:hypothetical protein
MTSLVFATSLVDSDPARYQGWCDYYNEFFHGMDVQLLMINDGPTSTSLRLGRVEQLVLSPHLGRKHVWNFPGWKRSFWHGIKTARERGISQIAHIESDCYVTPSGRDEFLNHLSSQGYFVPFCPHYRFSETALQVLNEEWVVNYYYDRYSCEDNWHEEVDFEDLVDKQLKPQRFLNGNRYEGDIERIKKGYTFVSGCVASDFMRLVAGDL